ncbi:undecaprenyl-phosphate glucose phosphotransferase [Pontibacter qinzhouensis]|uniref:Undecaprenyl-phosphate glucose phosphotransferase n=1 Tax=Pontibacter qinzhouensis TaxID=2603253 RepID=A0A5C8K754_9BACT|nr:undecaprenyl-phosphate glucose phosphotransferase [Pontibacter qinzhouensis]TXK44898.1 undecaprenyl-phosphate glucose phosphotransferase [Pontibacter qinzhouensis]
MPGLYTKYIKLVHAFGDLVAVTGSVISTFMLYFGSLDSFKTPYKDFLFYSSIGWFICAALLGIYKNYRVARTIRVIVNAIKVIFLYILLIEATLNVTNIQNISRDYLSNHYILLGTSVIIWRLLVIYALKYWRRKGYNFRKVIIVGYGNTGLELRRYFSQHPEHGYRFIGFFDDKKHGDHIIGRVADIERFIVENGIDEIYCSPHELSKEQVVRLLDFVDNNLVRMKFLPEPGDFQYRKLKIDFYDMLPVLILRSIPLDDAINKILKRTFDIVFSLLIILFVLSWLIPVIALLIKLDSKGPVFFKQERSGIDNRIFNCWKLRSMYVNSDSNTLQARRGDARITKIGAFIRRTSIDELPQFFNVLIGNMSVVGPRPHMLKHTEEYALIVDKFMLRHFIKPGITGLSQVRGYRGETTEVHQMRARVKLDIFYLENWSFLLDLKIIFYTVYNMVRGDNNAF